MADIREFRNRARNPVGLQSLDSPRGTSDSLPCFAAQCVERCQLDGCTENHVWGS